MNLVKIADLLKNASDQALASALSNPNSATPSYMVISELKRREKLRAADRNPEEPTSVAEDTMRGLAGLRANRSVGVPINMRGPQPAPAPQGFAQGGEVQRYAGGELVWGKKRYAETDDPMMVIDPATGRPISRSLVQQSMQSPWNTVGAPAGANQDYKPSTQKFLAENFMAPTSAAPSTAPAVAPPVAPLGRPPVAAAPAMPRPAAPAAPVAATPEKMEDWGQQIKDIVGKQADAYQKQADIYAKQAEQLDKTKSTDISLALMQAGFGIMGGRSQFAAENIGQGAAPAVQQYAAMDRARREQAQKLALGQGALGIEQLGSQLKGVSAGAEYGLGKEKLDIARKEAESNAIYKRALAGAAGAGKSDANAMRLMGLREKAIEALEKQFDFQALAPQQQEAAIQRRMQLLSGQYSTMSASNDPLGWRK